MPLVFKDRLTRWYCVTKNTAHARPYRCACVAISLHMCGHIAAHVRPYRCACAAISLQMRGRIAAQVINRSDTTTTDYRLQLQTFGGIGPAGAVQ